MAHLEGITNKIISDAEEKAKLIIENAKTKAAEISAATKKDIDEKEKQLRTHTAQQATLKAERIIANAQLEGKKKYLASKQALIEGVFTNAARRLAMLEDADYEKLIAEMSKNIKGEKVLLPRDKQKGTGGGFIMKDGKVEYNFSFDALIKRAKEKLEGEIVSILFG
ncbi:MAG: hypothetical protein GX800_02350 [Clostridiaceae bacterium]|nr:hypothetical protein [Clostridiaceae bacterium]